jgi:hypothetical protein
MAKRSGDRSIRRFEGKTRKVTVCLAPQVADRLKLLAVYLGLDLGDVVTEGVLPLLAGFSVAWRSSDGQAVAESSSRPSAEEGPRLAG